jgi:hypothetical protein
MLIATLSADPALAFGKNGPSYGYSESCEGSSLRCAVVSFLAKLHSRKDRPYEHKPPPSHGKPTTVPEIDAASGLAAMAALGAALALVYDRRRRMV